MATLTESRSTIAPENLDEVLSSEKNVGDALWGGQQQYETPRWFAEKCMAKLPHRTPSTILDPQCAAGNLLSCSGYGGVKFGIDLDNRLVGSGVAAQLIIGNCVKVFDAIDDIAPDLRFVCVNANPPFNKKWLVNGKYVDSTLVTWNFALKRGNFGFFIANDKTLTELGIYQHPWVYESSIHGANEIWSGMKDTLKIGVVWWKRPDQSGLTSVSDAIIAWTGIRKVIDEEKQSRPDFNIYVDKAGFLQTYLSTRSEIKLKLTRDQITRLHKVKGCHPLTLTAEVETRRIMADLVNCGFYTIQPEAKQIIQRALDDVATVAAPIMPTTPFEAVAYADEQEALVCENSVDDERFKFTAGASYRLTTGTYKFTELFTRKKVHFDEQTETTFTRDHECQLSGQDRYIMVKDDRGKMVRFQDRIKVKNLEFEEKILWQIFHEPKIATVTETSRDHVELNLAILRTCEMLAGYTYMAGQSAYLSRVATKDAALVAAETGAGKSLMAISLMALKTPARTLIVAPQGTVKSRGGDDDEEDDDGEAVMSAPQWISELNRFAPYLQVWEIFSHEDYKRICSINGGKLPPGVYITYYEAMFQNGAIETAPQSWNDERLNKYAKQNGLGELDKYIGDDEVENKRHWCDSVGHEEDGIRCIIQPCLSTLIGHEFDCVILDEAHRVCNLTANVTQMLIRLQPKFRYALTATPIPNVITNLFSLMGWLAVPEWYRGGRRNAAWPYAREDCARFDSTFRSEERDLTQEAENKRKDPKYSGKCVKTSPIISSPARLLKLVKPTLAYISKRDCNPNYIPPRVIDVRVRMGRQQSVLYGHFLDRSNIKAGNPLVRARKQSAWLRNICADPAHFRFGGPKVHSNMNPKIIAILELVRDMLARGEQVVIINSRVGLTSTLQEKLTDAGVSIARIDSTIPAEQHSNQANLFKQGKASVMLMGIKCAAAYSFDACPNEIIGSLEYSYGPFNQACGRIDRVTNKVVKNIYVILYQNSIEEIMYETVAVKGDAATICLKGQRIPRDFKPVDAGEVLANAIDRFDLSGATPETECETKWPKLCNAIRKAMAERN